MSNRIFTFEKMRARITFEAYDDPLPPGSRHGIDIPNKTANALYAGGCIRTWRLVKEVSQTELARLSGINQAQLSRIESGLATAGLFEYQRFAAVLGCTVEDLLYPPPLEVKP